MTDAIETISLTEGMPLGASPSNILSACSIRRERTRQDKIDISLATANLILGGISGRMDTLESVRHMFTDEEYEEILAERGIRRERASRLAQIEKLRRMSKQ